ncbi:MAG: hypothetical protein EOP86_00835 [Verrucomicrobiaceae bacterium]|nr:MAG: hypothetical protein EOP86_00835 [Verrucomicrobiaceae bacterium]
MLNIHLNHSFRIVLVCAIILIPASARAVTITFDPGAVADHFSGKFTINENESVNFYGVAAPDPSSGPAVAFLDTSSVPPGFLHFQFYSNVHGTGYGFNAPTSGLTPAYEDYSLSFPDGAHTNDYGLFLAKDSGGNINGKFEFTASNYIESVPEGGSTLHLLAGSVLTALGGTFVAKKLTQ